MRFALPAAALAAAALSLAAPARADDPPPAASPTPSSADLPPGFAPDQPPSSAWGLHAGDTVPRGDYLLYGEIGWPDLSLGVQRGFGDAFDAGLRFSMIYGVHYLIPKDRPGNVNDRAFGFGFTVPLRFTLHRSERISVLVHADPGVRFDYLDSEPRNGGPFVAPQIPIGIDLGVHLTPRTTLTLGLDMPIAFQVSPRCGNQLTGDTIFCPAALIAFLPGVSLERRFTEHFGMSANVRPGILYGVNRTGSATDVALLSQLGFFGRI
jgi:hypothetical protein